MFKTKTQACIFANTGLFPSDFLKTKGFKIRT